MHQLFFPGSKCVNKDCTYDFLVLEKDQVEKCLV